MASVVRSCTYAALAIGLAFGCGNRTQAALITYTQTVTGSGFLNASQFSNALVTITATGDTNNVVLLPGSFPGASNNATNDVSVAVTVAGVGSAALSGTFAVNLFLANLEVRQRVTPTSGPALVTLSSSSLLGYNLKTDRGPFSDPSTNGSAFLGNIFNTTTPNGGFSLSQISGPVTFRAQLAASAVPEPSSLALCGLGGLAGLGFARHRRRRRAA